MGDTILHRLSLCSKSNLYISETFNCRILKWNIASDTITVAVGGTGCGTALNQFDWCDGLYSDRQYPQSLYNLYN